jgi:hypothetical protein
MEMEARFLKKGWCISLLMDVLWSWAPLGLMVSFVWMTRQWFAALLPHTLA